MCFSGCFWLLTMERVITEIKVQKKNPDRVSIYLDGEFGFGLSRIVAAWLQVGQHLGDQAIESLLNRDTDEVAYNKALHFLQLKPRTEKEIRSKLIENEFTQNQIEAVIQRLREAGLIADERYAQEWVENRNQLHPRSRRLVAMELRRKGITENAIEEALKDSLPDDETALQAAMQYSRKIQSDDRLKFQKRMSAFLARRGFSYETIVPVVETIWKMKESEKHQS